VLSAPFFMPMAFAFGFGLQALLFLLSLQALHVAVVLGVGGNLLGFGFLLGLEQLGFCLALGLEHLVHDLAEAPPKMPCLSRSLPGVTTRTNAPSW
jgi:hypothetical protein